MTSWLKKRALEAAWKAVCPTDGPECPTEQHQTMAAEVADAIEAVAREFAERAVKQASVHVDIRPDVRPNFIAGMLYAADKEET